MRELLVKSVLPIAALMLLVFAISFVFSGRGQRGTVEPQRPPAASPYEHSVAAAGLVDAQTESISVGAPLPGIVLEVAVKEGDHVAPGALLFRLDDRQLLAEREVRRAALQSAKAEEARLENLPREEDLAVRKAQVDQADVTLREKADTLARWTPLAKSGTVTEEAFRGATFAHEAAAKALQRANKELEQLKAGASKWEKGVAAAAVAMALAQLQQTQIELDRLAVRAPKHAGEAYAEFEVLQVNVRPGEFVGTPSGASLIVLGNTQRLHVRADIDENDIPRIRARLKRGNPATARAKGELDKAFPLELVRVKPNVIPKRSLTGQNTERVDTRVLQVIYAFKATDAPFYVGQQVDVFIDASNPSPGSAGAEAAKAEGESPAAGAAS